MGCKISLVGENRILKNKIVLNLKLDFITPIRVAVGISLVVQWAKSVLPMQGAWIRSLVRELDPHSATKTWHTSIKKKKKE